MLQILQTKNYGNYMSQINDLGISEFFPNVVEATDNDEILAVGIYHFDISIDTFEKKIIIDYITKEIDLSLFDGMVRSMLFIAMMKEIDTAEFRNCDKSKLLKLGFVTNDNNCLQSISEFMTNCKSCGNV